LAQRKKMQQLKMFDDYVRKAVDSGLSIIGETGKGFVYHSMENQHNVPLMDLPRRIEVFHNALWSAFGDGARIIEKFVAIRLYESLNLEFKARGDWTLKDYVEDARKILRGSE